MLMVESLVPDTAVNRRAPDSVRAADLMRIQAELCRVSGVSNRCPSLPDNREDFMEASAATSKIYRFKPAAREKGQLLCFSHLRWNFVFQRPQHLLTAASRHYDVFFVEEPRFEHDCSAHLDVQDVAPSLTVVTPVLPEGLSGNETTVMQRSLLHALFRDKPASQRIKWYYTPMALDFTNNIEADLTIYDCMDELSAFRGAPANLSSLEHKLMQEAGLMFTGGRSLYEAKMSQHGNVHCFPSSIDAAHFGKARAGDLADPADQKDIAHPRIGFFGVIDERLDSELLRQAAESRPDLNFVMLGPVVKIDPASLPRLPNIHWLGQKAYADLPAYLAHWDAGFMPFAINEATRFISPTKTPEFLAAGLPVVSTPVRDVVADYGETKLVSIAGSARELIAEIDKLLAMDREPWLKRVDEKLKSMSWAATWAEMNALVTKALRRRRTEPLEKTGRYAYLLQSPSGRPPVELLEAGSGKGGHYS
jgi:glycosyltransferase involved in cell wall biosynthesis